MTRFISLLAMGAAVSALFYLDRFNRPRSATRAAPGRSWDDYLAGRVRAALPKSIQVAVHNAAVTLRGSVPYNERDRMLAAALAIPGIERVINLLEAQGRPADLGYD
ncbi:MAG TPA: BON domain-containing protein [Burkholderiales bacterium]